MLTFARRVCSDLIYVGTPEGREIVAQIPAERQAGDQFDVDVGMNAITVEEWEAAIAVKEAEEVIQEEPGSSWQP